MPDGNAVLALEMGEQVNVYELAERMIRLFGRQPGVDIEIEITGMRPGEKLVGGAGRARGDRERRPVRSSASTRWSMPEGALDRAVDRLASIADALDDDAARAALLELAAPAHDAPPARSVPHRHLKAAAPLARPVASLADRSHFASLARGCSRRDARYAPPVHRTDRRPVRRGLRPLARGLRPRPVRGPRRRLDRPARGPADRPLARRERPRAGDPSSCGGAAGRRADRGVPRGAGGRRPRGGRGSGRGCVGRLRPRGRAAARGRPMRSPSRCSWRHWSPWSRGCASPRPASACSTWCWVSRWCWASRWRSTASGTPTRWSPGSPGSRPSGCSRSGGFAEQFGVANGAAGILGAAVAFLAYNLPPASLFAGPGRPSRHGLRARRSWRSPSTRCRAHRARSWSRRCSWPSRCSTRRRGPARPPPAASPGAGRTAATTS